MNRLCIVRIINQLLFLVVLFSFNSYCSGNAGQRYPMDPTACVPSSAGYPVTIKHSEFAYLSSDRLLVILAKDPNKGTVHAEFPHHIGLPTSSPWAWTNALRTSLPASYAWSVYTDASWRATHPPQAQAVFGTQGTHEGCGALFLSADTTDWCAQIAAVRFEIPPTLRSLGGTAQVTELLAIHAGKSPWRGLLGCLAAVKQITRRWTPGRAFNATGAALVTAARALLSPTIPAWTRQQWGIFLADALTKNRDVGTLPHSPIPHLRVCQVLLRDLLASVTPLPVWQWADNDSAPPSGTCAPR